MGVEFGLSKPAFLHDWTVVRRDIARWGRCDCPGCNIWLDTGIAYIAVNESGDEFQLGPECAKKYDPNYDPGTAVSKQSLPDPDVFDISGGMAAIFTLKRPSQRSRLLIPPYKVLTSETHMAKLEKKSRHQDEAYLYLLAKKLPALGFVRAPQTIMDVWEAYIQDRKGADLSAIRKLRENAGFNSMELILDRYTHAEFINRFLHPDQYPETVSGKRYDPGARKKFGEPYQEPYKVVNSRKAEDSLKEYRKILIDGKSLPPEADDLLDQLLLRTFTKRPRVVQRKVMFFFSGERAAKQMGLSLENNATLRIENEVVPAPVPGPVAAPELMLTPGFEKKPHKHRAGKRKDISPRPVQNSTGHLFPAA